MRKLTLFAASFLTFSALAQSPCPQRNEPGVYTVQPGDDWSFIAREFDISVRELKEQNGYRDGDVLEPCTPLFIKKSPEKTRAKVAKQGGEVHKVRTGERISDIARTYGYTEERFREFNGLSDNEEVNIGAVLWNTHCNCADVRTANAEKPKSSNARDYASDFDDKERGLASKQEDARRDAQKSGLSKSFSKTTMSKEEGDMITEINLLRSDPKSYARFVEAWQKEHPQTNNKVVKELIDELRNTSRLGLLQPEECLYTTAKKHAKDQKGTGSEFSHKASDGRWPWQRVVRECPNAEDGGENFLACTNSIREAMIVMLTDANNPDRSNRKNVLDANWTTVACHKAGKIGKQDNLWIQMFGR